MPKPPLSILGCHGEQRLTDRFFQGLARPGPRAPKKGLDLGEGLFNRGQIGGVGREKQQLASFVLNELADSGPFMDTQIIHHHDLARTQTGDEEVLEVSFKRRRIGRPKGGH